MKKIFWFLIAILIVIIVTIGIFLSPWLVHKTTCHNLREATWEEGTVWFRPVYEGGDCNVDDPGKLLVQFCYGQDRLEYKYCQNLGAFEKKDSLNLLCIGGGINGNFFLLFNDVCENTNFCEDSKLCEYNANDNICCAKVRFKDVYFKLRSRKVIESSKLKYGFSVK